jgi:alpha-methylacyl-CoA racemase
LRAVGPRPTYVPMTALQGIRVLEMAGLAPVPYCGMLLADFGAEVVRVDRMQPSMLSSRPEDPMARGKRSIRIDLKKPDGVSTVLDLLDNSDVLLDAYRPGVMERMGLGPEAVMKRNPRLVYARLTGYGQTGPDAGRAGHDINYIALSGALSLCGRAGQPPAPPANLLADFAGGGLMCAFGVVVALLERTLSGFGQVIDASMAEGAASLTTATHYLRHCGLWAGDRGQNLLDSGAPWYDVYETRDGRWVAIGALEPAFFATAIAAMGLLPGEVGAQMDPSGWPKMRQLFAERFRGRTRDDWMEVFGGIDGCVAPVLELGEVQEHPQHQARSAFFRPEGGPTQPEATPRLSRTPGQAARTSPAEGQNTREILAELGYSASRIDELAARGVVA